MQTYNLRALFVELRSHVKRRSEYIIRTLNQDLHYMTLSLDERNALRMERIYCDALVNQITMTLKGMSDDTTTH